MKKVLLAAINAKYIHSNLAVYSLRAYASRYAGQIELAEFTINQQKDYILQEIYRKKPDILAFSCYIWNIEYVMDVVENIALVLPDTKIWLGGPEVSYDSEERLRSCPQITGIMQGEGEKTFLALMDYYLEAETPGIAGVTGKMEKPGIVRAVERREVPGTTRVTEKVENPESADCLKNGKSLADIPGIVWRENGKVCTGRTSGPEDVLDMDEIPFVYEHLEEFSNKIIYYESSRGCPFSCSYCLSSIDKRVRFRSGEKVKRELQFFLDHQVPQVKFVDRTFNCRHEHAMEIWRYILEHDNGITNFHFEIEADILREDELELLERMRPGLVQLEIGVQSTNPRTLEAVHRRTDFEKIAAVSRRIAAGHNVHQHLDLIAGLPYEDYESFRQSFRMVYELHPQELQLGFLKVLKGSGMQADAKEYDIVFCRKPVYEVLSTQWLSFDELLKLKGVEEMLEVYYNSQQFGRTIRRLEKIFENPFDLYQSLAEYYERKKLSGSSFSRMQRLEILRDFAGETDPDHAGAYDETLILDLYLRENAKTRPEWAWDLSVHKEEMMAFYRSEERNPIWLKGYEGYNWKQIQKMTHLEYFAGMEAGNRSSAGGQWILFDYKRRDPLNYNAEITVFPGEELPKSVPGEAGNV